MLQAIARLLGWRPPAAERDAAAAASLVAAPPPGLAVVRGGGTGMPVPLLDPASLRVENRARALAAAQRNPKSATVSAK